MKVLSEWVVRRLGWSFVGALPDDPKLVIIGAPHTSNWDFFLFLAALNHFDLKVRFMIKDGLMKWPASWFFRRLGAIPVDVTSSHGLVEAAVSAFNTSERMVLVLSPEGTRSRVDGWKSGFWRIADTADVPVVMSFIDGATKTLGFGPAMRIDGDPEVWMDVAREFYSDKAGVKPEEVSPVQL
ncbi:MAG: 1-acyl-sn-glycerol-3-phosphate acyltransferase [Acidimicrobiia bacterium]